MNLRTATATLALGSAALLLTAALGWLFLLGPALGTIGEARAEQTEAQDRAVLLTGQLAQLRTQAEELPAVRRQAARLDQVFPTTADQPGFFAQVSEAARDAGLGADDVTTLSPGVPVAAGVDPAADPAAAPAEGDAATVPTLAVQAVTVSVTGDYDRLTRLLDNLGAMDRAFLLQSVSLAGADGAELTLSLTGSTFVAPPLAEAPDVA